MKYIKYDPKAKMQKLLDTMGITKQKAYCEKLVAMRAKKPYTTDAQKLAELNAEIEAEKKELLERLERLYKTYTSALNETTDDLVKETEVLDGIKAKEVPSYLESIMQEVRELGGADDAKKI